MKNIVHLFSREVVSAFLEFDHATRGSKNFEFMVALLMHRIYEDQWMTPTMIGFYISDEHSRLLGSATDPDTALFNKVLADGIVENHQIDFVIATVQEHQEFQLKRFGINGQNNSTNDLIAYLNDMHRHYSPADAACLIAIADIEAIDLPKVSKDLYKDGFPFSELLLIGVVDDRFLVAGILPKEGWTIYDLRTVVN